MNNPYSHPLHRPPQLINQPPNQQPQWNDQRGPQVLPGNPKPNVPPQQYQPNVPNRQQPNSNVAGHVIT